MASSTDNPLTLEASSLSSLTIFSKRDDPSESKTAPYLANVFLKPSSIKRSKLFYLVSKSVTQADRCLLVRLNRHFNEFLTPVLYRSIKVDAQASVLLTKTLLKKRHLAQYVRALSLGRLPFQWASTMLQYAPERKENASNAVFIPESLEIMRNVTRSTDEEAQWKKDLMCDHEEAWAGVLLLLLGGLQELHMKFQSSYRYTQTVISQAEAMQFPRLETVRADQVSDATATRVHCALPFFRFPAMRVFTSEGLREQPAEAPKRLSPISSSITHLRLEQNMLTADTLRALILSCPNLERPGSPHPTAVSSRH
jgi:hypothetical protein